jgi:hypothetical protein
MKSCPQCGRSFPDEYSFCLSDGTTLISDQVRVDEEATVVRPQTRDRIKTSTIVLFTLAIILTLTLGATIGVLYVFWPRQQTAQQAQIEEASPAPTVTPRPQSTAAPEKTIQPRRTPVPSTDDASTPSRPPGPESAADPGVTRISFRPGRISDTVSGTVIKNRAYVLYAKNGQNLMATVRSNGGCVTFDGGSPRVTYSTKEGDNALTLVNNCGESKPFRLTVRIR